MFVLQQDRGVRKGFPSMTTLKIFLEVVGLETQGMRDILQAKGCKSMVDRCLRGDIQKKQRDFLGIFPKEGGGGLFNSQNFCKFTKLFLVCQNHSQVPKHVLQ